MLIDQALDWWCLNSGEVVAFDRLQPYSILLKWPSADQAIPVPMLLGAATIQATELGDISPFHYRDRLAGPWRKYSEVVMEKHRRIANSKTPEFGCSVFPSGLWGSAFNYEWITLPCRIRNAPLLITISQRVVLH